MKAAKKAVAKKACAKKAFAKKPGVSDTEEKNYTGTVLKIKKK